MPTVRNYFEFGYVLRREFENARSVKRTNVVRTGHFNGNGVIVVIKGQVNDEVCREIIDEVMENEFSATDHVINFLYDSEHDGTEIKISLPLYIADYLIRNDGKWN